MRTAPWLDVMRTAPRLYDLLDRPQRPSRPRGRLQALLEHDRSERALAEARHVPPSLTFSQTKRGVVGGQVQLGGGAVGDDCAGLTGRDPILHHQGRHGGILRLGAAIATDSVHFDPYGGLSHGDLPGRLGTSFAEPRVRSKVFDSK